MKTAVSDVCGENVEIELVDNKPKPNCYARKICKLHC